MSALFLGIDGGGTWCRARLVDCEGRVRGQGQAGAANLGLGVDAAWASLMTAAADAIGVAGLDDPDDQIHAAIGLAGTSRTRALDQLAAQPHVFASLAIESDAAMACLGAHGGGDGGIVIAGTGSIGFGLVGGRKVRVGGYGFPVSDEGGGAGLGLAALKMALRALDRRVAMTPMLAEVLQRFSYDVVTIVDWADIATPADYAALAPVVVRHAKGGDVVASSLMSAAGVDIAELATALLADGVPLVSLTGGLAVELQPWLPADLRQKLTPPQGDALLGAVLRARRNVDASRA